MKKGHEVAMFELHASHDRHDDALAERIRDADMQCGREPVRGKAIEFGRENADRTLDGQEQPFSMSVQLQIPAGAVKQRTSDSRFEAVGRCCVCATT